ncbi:MAG: hypothetical protein ACI8ZM_001273 [Crocinitomix sp.]|jgi:hypothetical protein
MKNMKFTRAIVVALIGISAVTTGCKKEGCTDPVADNYNDKANHDDNSCTYDGVDDDTTIIDGSVLYVTEDVTAPTVWNSARVEVCGDINVTAALTIPAGVNLFMCAGASLEIQETGSLTAVGTALNPIIFKGDVASPGYWEGIGILSNNPNNQFDYVTVSDAGSYWAWDYANVYVNGLSKLSVQNSTFSNSEGNGLYLEASASFPIFSNNSFSNNTKAGLNILATQVGSIDGASNYNISNGEDFIHVRGATISNNTTWAATTTPLLIHDNVDVTAGLTISAGSNILMEADASIEVEESGYLTALGTASQPISIQGRFTSAGYWRGIIIKSNNPNNQMTYVNFNDGGSYWAYDYATLDIRGRLAIDNCAITNSNSWAIVAGGSAAIYCSGAVQTDAAGVQSVNSISGNGVGPDADCMDGGCTVLFL